MYQLKITGFNLSSLSDKIQTYGLETIHSKSYNCLGKTVNILVLSNPNNLENKIFRRLVNNPYVIITVIIELIEDSEANIEIVYNKNSSLDKTWSKRIKNSIEKSASNEDWFIKQE